MGIEKLIISGIIGLFTPDEARIIFPNKEFQIKGASILRKNGGYSRSSENNGYGCSIKQLELLDREKIPYERLK